MWNPPLPEEQNGFITGYTIHISLLEKGEMFQILSEANNVTVASLRPHSTYNFIISAQTSVGIGPFTPTPVSVRTLEDGMIMFVVANVLS